MAFLDSNILIYSGEEMYATHLQPYVTEPTNLVSVISIVETLGYFKITPAQIVYFENIFKILKIITVDDMVIQKAVQIRQMKKISLGDSLIAATALIHDGILISRNTVDFSGILGLTVINPIP